MTECNLDDVIERYDGRIPRYTSYPTAVELRPCENDVPVRAALRAIP
jgi:hypothetical protein